MRFGRSAAVSLWFGLLGLGCSSGTHAAAPRSCGSPTTNADTGLVTCEEGYAHRPSAKTCGAVDAASSKLPRADGEDCGADGMACEAFAYGYCSVTLAPLGTSTRSCVSGCATDDDCGAHAVCVCGAGNAHGICRASECRTDQDCGTGQLCATSATIAKLSSSNGDVCDRNLEFACQRAADECQADSECSDGPCSLRPSVDADGQVIEQHRVCSSHCSI